jgi:phosphoribosylamine--glycine ligase
MNVLILGSGGREHALSWKVRQSPLCGELYIAPGNAGTAQHGTNLDIEPLNFDEVSTIIESKQIDMLIVGPEEPLVKGIRDEISVRHPYLMIIGPDAAGARLEGSKAYAKEFMLKAGIPTASYASFHQSQLEEAIQYLQSIPAPYVLKADGLAAGKGVVITSDIEEAIDTLKSMMGGLFGTAGHQIVIESFLDGIEYSCFVLSDGIHWQLLPVAKDYKRVGEGDTGPNTGGMGAVTPVPFFDDELRQKTIDRIIQPTMDQLQNENIIYKGFIFIGLINVNGDPYVIEYNCRMGDPETEVVMPALENDLMDLLIAVHKGTLNEKSVSQLSGFVTTIMLCSGGYPGDYEKGKSISIPNVADDILLFHAGTKVSPSGEVVTNGGRVMAVTCHGEDMMTSLAHGLAAVKTIDFEGMMYRKDIGFDLH